AVRRFLADEGYRIAEVTMSFDDYAYNDPYARCLAGEDTAAIDWMKASYLERAAQSLAESRERARAVYGRDIPHVLLLHIGGFEPVMLPRLPDLPEQQGVQLVTLPEAESAPAYLLDPDLALASGATLLDQMAAAKGLPPPAGSDDTLARLGALCR